MKALLAVALLASTTFAFPKEPQCLCLPSDSCWPTASDWASLNSTVNGRLIKTVPIGYVCHDPTYDEAACADLQANWTQPETHFTSPSSIMQSYFTNDSCNPFTAESSPCTLGNYVSYSVNVSSSDDVIAAINFAQSNNIRFVIKNTGHDYLGRSTGDGALSVWTHNMDSIEYVDWSDATYDGPSFKIGAGVMGYQILEAATAQGLVVVTGECPTVGVAGGYTQGGGHSVLSTNFGLAADQTLEFEVVTASGELVTATRNENFELFWALSGGGAGNFGVVISVTVRAHPDTTVSGAALAISASATTTINFYEAISQFQGLLPAMIDQGATVIYEMTSSAFYINPITAYNKTSTDVQAILDPFISVLSDLSVPYEVDYTQFASYYDHYNHYMGPLPYGNLAIDSYNYGGRLIPRSLLETDFAALGAVLQNLTTNGVTVVGVGLDVSQPPGNISNAVFSPWRDAAVTMQIGTPWSNTAPLSEMVADQLLITDVYVPLLEAITPDSGCYENESNFLQPNWQETFFAENLFPLLAVKVRWDPDFFFYALKGVGSDYWSVDESGRMCKTWGWLR